ncbi:hypothetical protein SMICM304S_03097 [Streptomyces microflavus]
MTLQSARLFVEHPEAAERLGRAIDDLDTTIKIIRSTIFGLREHGPAADASGLRTRVVEAVDTAAPALGFPPALRMEGLIDTDVPQDMADHVIAVIVEALSNIAPARGGRGGGGVGRRGRRCADGDRDRRRQARGAADGGTASRGARSMAGRSLLWAPEKASTGRSNWRSSSRSVSRALRTGPITGGSSEE